MKIGILEAGLLREEMAARFDPYPVMFADFLALADPGFEIETVSVVRGETPSSIHACDGWLITGSRHGVYDNLDWMPPLREFIRELAQAGTPLVGVCFGHQIIAEALGGKVVKSDKGWGIGLHDYRIDQRYSWMQPGEKQTALYAFHQDQVIECPPGAEVFLSSGFCPYAGLAYGESVISVQAHPEFRLDYETALLEAYGGSVVPAGLAGTALAGMRAGKLADQAMVAGWFARFFRSRGALQAASNG